MPVELADLLRALRDGHGVNMAREAVPVIKAWALKRARQINAKLNN